jgi:hypothetical protein
LEKIKPEVFLRFRTINDELVEFKLFTVVKPTKRYGGLTDPEGHAKDSALPVMYRGKSTLARKKSSISINGISYKIPYMIRIPIFFTGMKGYYTDEFLIGVILAGKKRLSLKKAPLALVEGEKWIYKSASLVSGVLYKEKAADGIIMRLIPKKPKWALERIIETEVGVMDDEIRIRTRVGKI